MLRRNAQKSQLGDYDHSESNSIRPVIAEIRDENQFVYTSFDLPPTVRTVLNRQVKH